MAALAYKVIYSVSALDTFQLQTFLRLMGGKKSLAAAAYNALDTRGPKLSAILAVAKQSLSASQMDLFKTLLAYQNPLTKFRDKLAHWAVREGEGPPDSLVLQEPEFFNGSSTDEGAYVFSKSEMEKVLNKATTLAVAYNEFTRLLQFKEPWTAEQCAELNRRLASLAK